MHFYHSMIFMFIISFIIQYYLMSLIIANNTNNITNSIGKLYMSIIMGILMIIAQIYMHDSSYNVFSIKLYTIFIFILLVVIYFYRNQLFINDREYLREMIEHHSMALLTSNQIIKKSNDYNVVKLAKNIIETQNNEINIMKNLLNK